MRIGEILMFLGAMRCRVQTSALPASILVARAQAVAWVVVAILTSQQLACQKHAHACAFSRQWLGCQMPCCPCTTHGTMELCIPEPWGCTAHTRFSRQTRVCIHCMGGSATSEHENSFLVHLIITQEHVSL